MDDTEDAHPIRFRTSLWKLLGLVALAAWPLGLGWLFSRDPDALLHEHGIGLITPIPLACLYALWLWTHVFTLTEEALVRTRLGGRRRIEWEDVRSVQRKSTVILGAGHGPLGQTGLLQTTRWELLGRRGWVLLILPSVLADERAFRLAIEQRISAERSERIDEARARRGRTPNEGQDAVQRGRWRRWAQPDDEGGIAIPLEAALVFAPTSLVAFYSFIAAAM